MTPLRTPAWDTAAACAPPTGTTTATGMPPPPDAQPDAHDRTPDGQGHGAPPHGHQTRQDPPPQGHRQRHTTPARRPGALGPPSAAARRKQGPLPKTTGEAHNRTPPEIRAEPPKPTCHEGPAPHAAAAQGPPPRTPTTRGTRTPPPDTAAQPLPASQPRRTPLHDPRRQPSLPFQAPRGPHSPTEPPARAPRGHQNSTATNRARTATPLQHIGHLPSLPPQAHSMATH